MHTWQACADEAGFLLHPGDSPSHVLAEMVSLQPIPQATLLHWARKSDAPLAMRPLDPLPAAVTPGRVQVAYSPSCNAPLGNKL